METCRLQRVGELGPETEVLTPPNGKNIDEQMLVDLRRMLTRAGVTS